MARQASLLPFLPDHIHLLLCHCSAAITLCLCAVQAGLLVPLLFLTVLFRQAAIGIFDKPQKVLSLRGAADLDKHDKVGLRLSCSFAAVLRGHPACLAAAPAATGILACKRVACCTFAIFQEPCTKLLAMAIMHLF